MKHIILRSVIITSIALNSVTFADTQSALSALEKGDKETAIELFEASSNEFLSQLHLAKLYTNTDLDEAEKWIEKAVKQEPDNAEVQYTLGVIRGYQAQDSIFSALSFAKKSKAAFERAVALEPDSLEYLLGLFRFHINAPSIAGGALDVAGTLAEKIATIDALEGAIAKIDVANEKDNPEEVKSLIQEGLKEHNNALPLTFQAGMIYLRNKEYEQAFKMLKLAGVPIVKENYPTDKKLMDAKITRYSALYQFGRAAVLSESNQEDGIVAFKAFLTATPVHDALPSRGWAEFRMAELHEQLGKAEEANQIYRSLSKTEDKRLRKKVKRKL